MRRFSIFLLLLIGLLILLVGCSSSHVTTELEAIAERAQARDEAQSYYMNQLGISAIGRTAYAQWQMEQFAPTYATFQAYRALSPKENELWGDYLKKTSIEEARKQAPGLYKQALALTIPKQQVFQEKMGRYLVDDKMGSLFIDFMYNVLLQSYGFPVNESMVKSIPQFELEFKGSPGYTENSFLDFLRLKYNLQ